MSIKNNPHLSKDIFATTTNMYAENSDASQT